MAPESNPETLHSDAGPPSAESLSQNDLMALIPDMELLESSTVDARQAAFVTQAVPARQRAAAPALSERTPPGARLAIAPAATVSDDPYADLMPELEPFDDAPAAAPPVRVAKPAVAPTPAVAPARAPQPVPMRMPAANAAPTLQKPLAPAPRAAVQTIKPLVASAHTEPPVKRSVKIPNPSSVVVPPVMDRDFILRNRIVELYLAGSLPIRAAAVFERFCRENPQIMDEIGLADRVHKGLTLLEAGGTPEPWQEKPKRFWESLYVVAALAALVLTLAVVSFMLSRQVSEQKSKVTALQQLVTDQPLDAAASSISIDLQPTRVGPTSSPAAVIGGASAQLATIKLNMIHSDFRAFRITIDRVNEGRVAVLNNLIKDSNGELGFSLNSSALGPGIYQFAIEGLDWRGDPQVDSWAAIRIKH